jgi:ABC-type uncharacterized transport system involved in gliding motility auxiliary subunit/ABC-type transport system involved in multi-copper enzyme maturation permease subunit
MNDLAAVLRREWQSAFATPLAYLFIAAYGALTTIATFEWGDLYGRGQADLSACFALQPWLLVWLAPALSMRLWAEERRHGTAEPLLVLPIELSTLVAAKWLAGMGLVTLALCTTLPLWATVAYLGHPDHGTILAGYLGSLLLSAALLSIGSAVSAATRHPVTAFIGTTAIGVALLMAGHPIMADTLRERVPAALLETLSDIGALAHHRAIVRGAIGLDDVLYFAAITAVGLTATGIILTAVRGLPLVVFHRRWHPVAVLLALLALLWAGAALVPRWAGRVRLDLTEEHLYTLAPATRELLAGLEQPVTLTLYASTRTLDATPAYANEARRVRELLADMTARARDRLHFVVIDPAPFSDNEDRAAEAGLRSLSLGESGDNLWLGLVADSGGRRSVVDLFEPNQAPYLEYRIARLIREVSRPRRPLVGLLSTLPTEPVAASDTHIGRPAWAVDDALRDQYTIRDIMPDELAVPQGLDALLILHPKGLSPSLVQSIDRYLTGGGRALIAIDPDAQFDGQLDDSGVGVDHASTLEPLLRTWGVRFNPEFAVGDLDNALLVGAGRGDRPVRHLGFLGFGTGNLAHDDALTRGLHRLDFATPGYLELTTPAGVTVTPLVQTSTTSAPLRVADLAFGATPETLRHGFHPTGHRYTLAAHLRGTLPSAFGNTSTQPADVVIVADTDWLADMMWIRDETTGESHYREPWANNGDFLLNIVDELTGGDALVGLRGREPMARPFTRLDTLRTQADRRLAAQLDALERELADVSRRLADLSGNTAGALPTNPQQQGELAHAELERRRLNRALRSVHHDMDRDAARLGRLLYGIDVGLPVALVFTVGVLILNRRRVRAKA